MITDQRAYVFGGPGGPKNRDPDKPLTEVVITIDNSGKTPAFLTSIEYGLCPERQWPTCLPSHMNQQAVLISKGIMGDSYRFPQLILPITDQEPLISFGKIIFNDVFGCPHHSGWAHRMAPPKWEPEVLPGAYNDWDRPGETDCPKAK